MRRVLFALLLASIVAPVHVASAEPHVVTARARTRAKAPPDDPVAKARQALAVIDGTAWTGDAARVAEDRSDAAAIARRLQPWRATILDRGGRTGGAGDRLDHAEHLQPGDGYYIRRPARAYGAPCVVEYLRRAVAEVRALYPDVPVLAIGDLSAEHGGELPGHVSHRAGRDVDVGFYFHHAAHGFETAGFPGIFFLGRGAPQVSDSTIQ